MIVGFSGTRHVPSADTPRIHEWLYDHCPPDAAGYRSGACTGFDQIAGELACRRWPHAVHQVFVPANRSRVVTWWRRYGNQVQLQEMPTGSRYADRNWMLVDGIDMLIYLAAFPEDHSQSARSGTWQTVRLARRAGCAVVGTDLESLRTS